MAKKEENKNNTEQIGYHKGCLATLVKEREELIRIIKVTEQLMQLHLKALKDLGVDLEKIQKSKLEDEIKK